MVNFTWKRSFLVISEILRPSVKTLTPDENYFLWNRENLAEPIQMKFSKKLKIFSVFFTAVRKSTFNFELFEPKMSLIAYVFPELWTRNRCLCKCIKNHVSVQRRTVNYLKVPKQCCYMDDTSLIIFGHQPGKNSVAKTLS